MSHGRIDPSEAWQVMGTGQSIAGALEDAASKLEALSQR
jgi:hypothetical protein